MINFTVAHEMNVTSIFNNTDTLYQRAHPWTWNFRTIFQLGGKVFALVFNGLLLVLLCRYHTLRTPFNLYVLNLTLANLANIVVMYPFQIFDQLNQMYFSSTFRCFVYRYLTYTIPGWINNAHLLIALNRFWALVFPISYRNYRHAHVATRPLFVCCATLVYLHIFLLPGLIADFMIPRAPLENYHCAISASSQPAWLAATQMCIHNMPVIVILIVYPFICVKLMRKSRRTNQNIDMTVSHPTASTGASVNPPTVTNRHPPKELAGRFIRLGRLRATCGNGFLTLTFLCLVVLVTLMPAQLFYTSLAFRLNMSINVAVTNFLYGLMGICDPVVFLLTVKNLREATGKLFKCRL